MASILSICQAYCEELEAELAEAKQQIIAYQIAKDNLELRLSKENEWIASYHGYEAPIDEPEQVYGA